MNKLLSYSDIILLNNFSQIKSRSECDPSSFFIDRKFKLGVVPANMECVIDYDIYEWLVNNGFFAIMHRFGDQLDFIEKAQKLPFVSMSIGTEDKDKVFLNFIRLNKKRIDYLTIDIANGWSQNMKDMVKYVRKEFPKVKIIGGNIPGNFNAVKDLIRWGCDAVKIGLGMGKSCSTYNQTGFGTPMFSAVLEAAKCTGAFIIADGQIRDIGDINKAYVASAQMVMIGSLFGACSNSPAPVVNGKKLYYGSASKRQKGNDRYVEGKDVYLEMTGSYQELLEEMRDGITSGMSYAGTKELSGFKSVEWRIR